MWSIQCFSHINNWIIIIKTINDTKPQNPRTNFECWTNMKMIISENMAKCFELSGMQNIFLFGLAKLRESFADDSI